MGKLVDVRIVKRTIEEIIKQPSNKNIVQKAWTAVVNPQYKIIATHKNHRHAYEAMPKIRGRKIPNG